MKTMHFQDTNVPISDVQFIFWAPKLSVCLTWAIMAIFQYLESVLVFWWGLLPSASVSQTQVAKSVQHLIDYNWPENKALIHYLLANETGCSFSCSLPAILPKPCTKHLLGDPTVAAGVGWAAHKPCRLVLDPQYMAETRGRSELIFHIVTATLTVCQFGKCVCGMAGAEAFKGQGLLK